MPSASRAGARRGTTTPVELTISADAPTSVTTHGQPHAMASAIVLGKPSDDEDETKTSRAGYAASGVRPMA